MSTGRGKRRARVTFQARSSSQDAMGGPSGTYTDYITVWARVISVRGSEDFKGQQFNPEVTHSIEIDASTQSKALTPLHRASISGRILDIISVNFGERDLDPIMVTCKERVLDTGTAQ